VKTRTKQLTITSTIAGLLVAVILADVMYIVPTMKKLRAKIDNDRASTIVVTQQQSNLAQLTQDLASIQTKQVELEKNIWTFSAEDTYFSELDQIAKNKNVTIYATAIADATPNGNLIPRSITLLINGKLERTLAAISAIQSISPIIAIQKLLVEPGTAAGDVRATVTGVTLWK